VRATGIAWVVAALVGCSDEPPSTTMPDAGADAGVSAPEPPAINWLAAGVPPIAIAPCPPGWREVHDSDVTTCDPYPETGPDACTEGFAHFPGGAGCEPVGSVCPPGEWSDGLPAAGVLYVRAGAPIGGDGTRAAPFARVSDAMSSASVGTIVALSRGRWDEVVRMRQGVTLQGTCAAESVLTSSVPSDTAGVVSVSVRGAQLRDVRIDAATRPGLWVVGPGAEVRIEGVIVSAARLAGVLVADRSRLAAARLVVRDTQSRERDRASGIGLSVEHGASAAVARALFERNREAGVIAVGAATSVTLEDAVVRDTQGRESDRAGGWGLAVQQSASAAVTHVLFERNRCHAIQALDPATSVTLEDVVVRDTLSQESDRTLGRGLVVQRGASADLTRGLFERNREIAIYVGEAATSARLTDVVVRDTMGGESDGVLGRGLAVEFGASAEVARALFERNREIVVFAAAAGTSVRLDDVVVRDTLSRESDRTFGRAFGVQGGASADVTRGLFERNLEIALIAHGAGTRMRLEDVVVRDTLGRESDRAGGRGLGVQDGAGVEVARGLFERNREVAVHAIGAGATVSLANVVIADTLTAACGAECVFASGGVGVGSYQAATVSMSQFVTRRAALCGVMIAQDGELDLSDGQVSESTIGACVQVADYQLSRLSTRVEYVGNGTNIAATDLPVPGASDPLSGP